MRFDSLGTELRFDHLTGMRPGACAFVGYRMPAGSAPQPARMESWVLRPSADLERGEPMVDVGLGVQGFVTGLYRTPSGVVYAVDFDGRLYVQRPDGEAAAWQTQDWGGMVELHGVWGLSDDHVFVWGRDAHGPRFWELFEGHFVNMSAPPSPLTCVAGARPDCLYAAGPAGYLGHWNGLEWRRIPIRSMRTATALHAVGEDEIWLTTDMGKLFEGSRHGWGLRAELDAPLCDVRRWRGELYVAARSLGLWRLEGRSNRLVPVDLMLPAIGLAGDEGALLVLTDEALAVTYDGQRFDTLAHGTLLSLRGGARPLWEAP